MNACVCVAKHDEIIMLSINSMQTRFIDVLYALSRVEQNHIKSDVTY